MASGNFLKNLINFNHQYKGKMKHKWIKVPVEDKWKPEFKKEFHCKVCECKRMKSIYGFYIYFRNGRISISAEGISCIDIQKENLKTID